MPDCKLATLAGYFAAAVTPCHRALADAQATGEVLLGLLATAAAARPPAPGPGAARPGAGCPGARQLSAAST